MLSYEESLKILKETKAIIEGHFILSSGLHSSKYVQCAKLLSFPNKASLICNSLAKKIKETFKNFNIIMSPAVGGIIVGYEIGKILDKETIFSERVNGKFSLRRGFSLKKTDKILIIEDVITTGKSSLECSKLADDVGAEIIGYACIIDRSSDKSKIKQKVISQIKLDIPTYNKENIPKKLSMIKPIKPGSRNL